MEAKDESFLSSYDFAAAFKTAAKVLRQTEIMSGVSMLDLDAYKNI